MNVFRKTIVAAQIVFLIAVIEIFSAPNANAQNFDAGEDARCIATCQALQAKAQATNNPALNCVPVGATIVPCGSAPVGSITGQCMMTGCKAISASGLNGGSISAGSGMSQLLQQVGQMVGQMLQGGGGGGGGGSDSGTSGTSATAGCTSYTAVSDATLLTSNPCDYYVPSTNSSVTAGNQTSSDLLNALNGSSAAPDLTSALSGAPAAGSSSASLMLYTNPNSGAAGTSGNQGSAGSNQPVVNSSSSIMANITSVFKPVIASSTNPAASVYTQGDESGQIDASGSGPTFSATEVNAADNSEVSGFFGANTFTAGINAVVTQWCVARPWSTNFLGALFSARFFDGLCSFGGYPVGTPAPQVTLTQSATVSAPAKPKPKQVAQPAATSTGPIVPAKVDIWAVPASVPLGTRTTIYWNTEGVSNCNETSPDGSFTQTSLSGGASTVPITQATTYSISCLDSAKNPVSDYVTVKIAI